MSAATKIPSRVSIKYINYLHGQTGTKAHNSWRRMLNRCNNKNATQYSNYGGRGITVCERWHKFENFLKDMGHPEANSLSLDRINVNGNYEPGNCRWADQKTQCRNKRGAIALTVNGETKFLNEWCEVYKVKRHTIMNRIRRNKMTPIEALTTTVRGSKEWSAAKRRRNCS